MPAPDQELSEQARKKKTIWLLAGGAASLALPLLGVAYLHWSANSAAQGPSGRSDVFERRDNGDKRLVPSQAAVSMTAPPPPSSLPTGGRAEQTTESSLDFIKPAAELTAKVAEPPKTATATTAAPAAAPAPASAPPRPAKTAAKKGKKSFTMPKLQPSRGFTNFNAGKGAPAKGTAAPQDGGQGGGNMQDLLKNLPPGAENNPQVQEYLKKQQGQ